MTNADLIRSMTDEELLEFLERFQTGDIDYAITFCSLCEKDHLYECDACLRWWLKLPAEE